MNKILLFFLFLIISHMAYSQNSTDSVFSELNLVLQKKQEYVNQKEERIEGLKRLATNSTNLSQQYEYNRNLYNEYRKFQVDLAIYYVSKNLNIASSLENKELADIAQLQLATLYSSSGKYRESENILKGIDTKKLSKGLLPDYYEAYNQFFSHYAANSNSIEDLRQVTLYRDSLLMVLDTTSLKYKITLAEKNIYQEQLDTAEKNLRNLLNIAHKNTPDYAMIAYLLGNIYLKERNTKQAEKYYSISAIADIKNSIKDNASIQNLALIYLAMNDIDKAYKFTQSAVEDAMFCNVQFRTILMSKFYSIINIAYKNKEAKSKLQTYLIFISILSVFLIITVIYVYKQMKKVSRIREELSITNHKLIELNNDISRANNQLNERNAELSESNHIKEEYIAHFFDLCSTYINKLENYRLTLKKKATNKQLDELFKMLKSTTIVDNELEELYNNFDTIFLNLYPTFIKDFNSLLINEEQVMLKPSEILNTELRIFALIRLGITDSVKIAAFLRYSISTIYNYRTKARNKAAVSRDEFEKKIMKIGAILPKTQ